MSDNVATSEEVARSTLTEAAVLVPVFRDPAGVLRVVLVLRGPGGPHGGQIGLPGGRRESSDPDSRAAALREAQEEIGLDPDSVEVLAELDSVETASTGFRIIPFLARVNQLPSNWILQESELAEIYEEAIDDLIRSDRRSIETWQLPHWSGPREIPFVWLRGHKLWGATYRILDSALPRVLAGEWTF